MEEAVTTTKYPLFDDLVAQQFNPSQRAAAKECLLLNPFNPIVEFYIN
jgi:hypothetical protein